MKEELKKEFETFEQENYNVIDLEEKERIEKELEELKEQILSDGLKEDTKINIQEKILEIEKEIDNHNRFKVDNLNKANWCLKRIGKLKQEIEDITEFGKIEKSKIEQFINKKIENCERNIEHFTILLKQYIDEERENNDPNFKISVKNGTVNYGKVTQSYVYDDKEMLKFCKENGYNESIRVKEELNKTNFKKMLQIVDDKVVTEDGLVVDNVEIKTEQKLNIRTKM